MDGRVKHGLANKRLYSIWNNIKSRCSNPNDSAFARYGGRGIKVCDRWKSPVKFFTDMEKSYEEHVAKHGRNNTAIDRINNNNGYSPENCRWATRSHQQNNKRTNRLVTIKGETMTSVQAAKKFGINPATFSDRINRMGWDDEKAALTPVRPKKT